MILKPWAARGCTALFSNLSCSSLLASLLFSLSGEVLAQTATASTGQPADSLAQFDIQILQHP